MQQKFLTENLNIWNKEEKLKIVTHHWGTNKNKGFEVYKYIDQLISTEPWKDMIEFTFIGNLLRNYELDNSNIVDPLCGIELGNELKKNHLYITGSLFEPLGNIILKLDNVYQFIYTNGGTSDSKTIFHIK